ncbi:DUF5655 domain-containing protein [Nakamurella lactea]|uniref:DUF5655 domain-containing protein n=1 Tax=Nakamurella lactea TaxID=459515 RepID=UPI000409268E|nr:DUF5655 domain-containing protein [Nakamurella lactea]
MTNNSIPADGPAADVWTVPRHLAAGSENGVALYRRFIELIERNGPIRYAVSKTTITLKGDRRGFAGAKPKGDVLSGYFDVQRQISDPRISNVSAYTHRLFVHHFRVESLDQLDDTFAGWLAEAYAVGAGAHLTR